MTPISEFKARAAIALLCGLVSAAAVTPFFVMGQPLPGGSRLDLRMPDTHDMFLHFDQMRDFYQGLAAGELYPRWEEDTNYGFGAPTTCFYPPGVYYLTALLYLLLHDWTRVLLCAHLVIMVASAAAIYLLARRCMSRAAAAVAMTAYVIFPYHAIDQYHRGALAELLAFVWMPLILLFADKLFATCGKSGRSSNSGTGDDIPHRESVEDTPPFTAESRACLRIGTRSEFRRKLFAASRPLLPAAGLALSYGAFLWSHPPTAFQFSLVLCPFLPLLALLRRNWKRFLWVCGGLVVGAGLSAAYLYPAAVEQGLIRHEIIQKIWPYHETYLFMYAGYSKRYFEFFQLLNASWCLYVAFILFTAFALLAFGGSRLARSLRDNIVVWTGMGCLASFLMLHISAPLGRRIPMIDIGVFSWRMLAITTLVAALLAGAIVQAATDVRRARGLFGVVTLAMLFGGGLFTMFGIMAPVNKQEAFQPEEDHTNYAVIPRTAPAHTDDLPEMDRTRLDGGAPAAVIIHEWEPQHRVIGVKSSAAARLFVRTFNYPGWTATLDGHPTALATDGETGAILLGIPAGEHLVTVDFKDTPARRLGARITLWFFLFAVAALATGAFARRPKEEL
jgi:hypothetical protein